MIDDLDLMICIAQSHAMTGKPVKYIPALELAYAQTIAFMAEHWQPKPKTITLTPADAENRIRHD